MRRIAITGCLAFCVAASASFGFAASSDASKRHQVRPACADISARTLRATSLYFSMDVTIIKNLRTATLHVNGAVGPGKLTVRQRLVDETPSGGPPAAPVTGAALIDGPFVYEHAPSGLVGGKRQWLRQRLADLGPASKELRNIRGLAPRSLLVAMDRARIRATPDRFVYSGWLGYDGTAVRRGLGPVTGNVQVRSLYAVVLTGKDGRVHRIRITGKTADGTANILLLAHLYAFDRPVKVRAPAQNEYIDPKSELLSN